MHNLVEKIQKSENREKSEKILGAGYEAPFHKESPLGIRRPQKRGSARGRASRSISKRNSLPVWKETRTRGPTVETNSYKTDRGRKTKYFREDEQPPGAAFVRASPGPRRSRGTALPLSRKKKGRPHGRTGRAESRVRDNICDTRFRADHGDVAAPKHGPLDRLTRSGGAPRVGGGG